MVFLDNLWIATRHNWLELRSKDIDRVCIIPSSNNYDLEIAILLLFSMIKDTLSAKYFLSQKLAQ